MSDPPTGQPEYVELINNSNKYLNLSKWQIGDSGDTDALGDQNIVLEPDSFLVISADTLALFNTYGPRPYYQLSSMATLNNGSDAIQVVTSSSELADSLAYSSDWGGNDIALERRSLHTASIYRENWGPSPNSEGGTPGAPNEISADQTPPALTTLRILTDQKIKLGFSERLNPNTITEPTNFGLSGSLAISSTNQTNADSVELALSTPLQNAEEYTLTVSSVEDIFGNAILQADTSFTYYKISPVKPDDIAINEFMAAPPSGSSEYVELYNHSDKSLNLQGWSLADNTDGPGSKIFRDQFIIPPDSFVVIAPDYTLSSSFPDIALVTMGSNFPTLNNGGDHIILRDANGTLLDSLAYQSDWGGDELALERRSIEVQSTFQANWSDAPNGFGTPGRANKIKPDRQSPELLSFNIESNTQISLNFSEQMDRPSLLNSENYKVKGISDIKTSVSSTLDSVYLELTEPLQNANSYTLSIANITDIFGNTIPKTDTLFTYYNVTEVDSGDVFINEFSHNPPSGSTEFVEIYNQSSKSFNLEHWTLSDNRNNPYTITDSQFVVPPDSFVVIAPDNTIMQEFSDILLVTMPNFPALNNNGDAIAIRNDSGTLIDSLHYYVAWDGNERSLERRTTEVSGVHRENWQESFNNSGTPGRMNNATADTNPPNFQKLVVRDEHTFQLIFSEKVSPASATNSQNYEITPSRDIQLISAEKDTVTLFLESPLISGETYEITVSEISDIFGNTLKNSSLSTEYLEIEDALPRDIVVNEILYNPGSSGKADFIELYNNSEKNVDLSNWIIGDASQTTTIDLNLRLRPGEFVALTGSNLFAQKTKNTVALDGFPSLNNYTPDDIYLRNENGTTIDSLRYYQSWGGSEAGTSIERKDPLAASNDKSNWQTNSSEEGSSAGAQNISFQKDTQPPELVFSKLTADANIEIHFSEFIQLTEEVRFWSDGQELQVTYFDSTQGNIIGLRTASNHPKKSAENNNTVDVKNLIDIRGNKTASAQIAVAKPPAHGDLVINEILFNPLNDPDDNRPDQGEYIELRNTQEHAISLENILLHDAPDEDGEMRILEPITTDAKWVPAQSEVLIYADQIPTFNESKIATFFDLEISDRRSMLRVDGSSLGLASSGDAIYIAKYEGSSMTTIDSVSYDERWHNPNIIDTRGIALERIAPTGPSDDKSNWGSSINPKGGTPNAENSIYQENGSTPEQIGIQFSPNPFSPDNDGFEDHLFINYQLEQPDYLVDVNIFDRYGRHIRKLADGKQAGLKGQIMWDGRKDDRSRNRIGIYIVVFEAYDSANGRNRSFKKTVVLARKLN